MGSFDVSPLCALVLSRSRTFRISRRWRRHVHRNSGKLPQNYRAENYRGETFEIRDRQQFEIKIFEPASRLMADMLTFCHLRRRAANKSFS